MASMVYNQPSSQTPQRRYDVPSASSRHEPPRIQHRAQYKDWNYNSVDAPSTQLYAPGSQTINGDGSRYEYSSMSPRIGAQPPQQRGRGGNLQNNMLHYEDVISVEYNTDKFPGQGAINSNKESITRPGLRPSYSGRSRTETIKSRKPIISPVMSNKSAWDSPFPKFPGMEKKSSYQQDQEIIEKLSAMEVGGPPQSQSRTARKNANQIQMDGTLGFKTKLDQYSTQAPIQTLKTPVLPSSIAHESRSPASGNVPAGRSLPPRPSTASGNRKPRPMYHKREQTMDSSLNSDSINRNRSFSDLNGQPYTNHDPKRVQPLSIEMPDFNVTPPHKHQRGASFEAHLQAPMQAPMQTPMQAQSSQRETNSLARQEDFVEQNQSFPTVYGSTLDNSSVEAGYHPGYDDRYDNGYDNGYDNEYDNTYDNGYNNIYDNGYDNGYEDGYGYGNKSYNQKYEAYLQNQGYSQPHSENIGPIQPPIRSGLSTYSGFPGTQNTESTFPSQSFPNEYHNQICDDSLPSHPPPVRPGLAQNITGAQPNNKPAPIRNYNGTSSINQMVGKPYPDTGMVATDISSELEFLRNVVKKNPADQASQLKLAKCLIDSVDTLAPLIPDQRSRTKTCEKNVSEAIRLLKKLVTQQNIEAMFYLADCYGRGVSGVEVDHKEAFSLYQSAAKAGHAAAAYRTAVCCELGNEEGGGTRKDPSKAIQWYKRAATLGDTPAMYKMGIVLLKGLLGQPRNPREAIGWLKRAAERADAENPHALHELALLYEKPQGSENSVIRDEAYSFQLFKQAADLGYKFSQFRLGCAYEFGLFNCPIDPKQSILWYSRAAAQGEHQSELSLSGWYLTGSEGVLQQNDTEAYLWARKAAMAGLAKAEYAMGYFTEVGIGSPANLDDAKRWYWRAAAQNFPKARERLEDLKRGGNKAVLRPKEKISRSKKLSKEGLF